MIVKAAILAGGYGKRLKPLTETTPKPLLRVAGKPIIVWQINWLRRYGIKNIVILAGYKGELLEKKLGDGSKYDVNLEHSFEKTPLGTAGAIHNARKLLQETDYFYVINGDVITNLDPTKLKTNMDKKTMGVLAAVPLPSPYGILSINEQDRIKGFIEKPMIKNVWISAGVYYLRKQILYQLPAKGDIERTTFPELGEQGKLKAHKYTNIYWRSIDNHKDLEETDKQLKTKNIL